MKATNKSNVDHVSHRFGERVIPSEQVFISRKHVYAMVNSTPHAPGHVLVCPIRSVSHLRDLTELETLELFVCV